MAAKFWTILEALYNLGTCLPQSPAVQELNPAIDMWSSPAVVLATGAALVAGQNASTCPGYSASNVQQNANGLTAYLTLAGEACNAYGTDLPNLTLTVEYQSSMSKKDLEFRI